MPENSGKPSAEDLKKEILKKLETIDLEQLESLGGTIRPQGENALDWENGPIWTIWRK